MMVIRRHNRGKRWSSVSSWGLPLKYSVWWVGNGWALTKWAAVVHSWFLLPAIKNKKSHLSKKQIADIPNPGLIPQPFGQPWAQFTKNYDRLLLGLLATVLCECCPEAYSHTWVPKYHLSLMGCSMSVKHPACLWKPLLPNEWSTTCNTGNTEEQKPVVRARKFVLWDPYVPVPSHRLWRRSLVKAGSSLIQSSNHLKYILSPQRLETKAVSHY